MSVGRACGRGPQVVWVSNDNYVFGYVYYSPQVVWVSNDN